MFGDLWDTMIEKKKTYFNWSSGKDASLALYHLQKDHSYRVTQLITTVNSHYKRVSMHGLRIELLQQQAQALKMPLTILELPEQPSMDVYNKTMREQLEKLTAAGYTHSAFGDIYLEDLRTYREQQLKPFGVTGVFPLWKRNTGELIREFIDLGFKAVVICVKSELLDASFVGRELDASFVKDLPDTVDPCGENGEFHTFCYDGPLFHQPIPFGKGEKVYREYQAPSGSNDSSLGFWFQDLLPENP